MSLGLLEIAILLCGSISILTVVGTVIYLVTKRKKNK